MKRLLFVVAAMLTTALIACSAFVSGLQVEGEAIDSDLLRLIEGTIKAREGAAEAGNRGQGELDKWEQEPPRKPDLESSKPTPPLSQPNSRAKPDSPSLSPSPVPPPRPLLPLAPDIVKKVSTASETQLWQLIHALDERRQAVEASEGRDAMINYLGDMLHRRQIESGGTADDRVHGIGDINPHLGEAYGQAFEAQTMSKTGAVYDGSNWQRPAEGKPQHGTPFFSPPDVRRMHAPTPESPGRTDPRTPPPKLDQPPDEPRQDERKTRRPGSLAPAPPSPRIPPGHMGMTLPVKGVRIQFHPAALAAARIPSALLSRMEDALSGGTSSESWRGALAQYTTELSGQFETQMQATTLSDATVVSLAAVCAEAGKYVDDWSRLPAHLRTPGPLRRIVGYALVADTATGDTDVLLMGASQGSGRPIDLDDLIVGLTAAWRDGDVPFCSLEPDPSDFHRPHGSLVSGVPKRSRFAQVMLTADYDMKKVTNGRLPVDVEGFVDLASVVKRDLSQLAGGLNSRMWFTPIQPVPGEIQVSASGTVTLFNARVQILTEAMTISSGGLRGTGRKEAAFDQVSRFMTEHLPEFERQVPSYAELHGLFDVVLLGQLLRHQGVRLPVLDHLVRLPTQTHDVPESFPAQNVILELEGLPVGRITGGVRMQLALRPDLIAVREDPRLEKLTEAALRDRTSQTLTGAELPIVTSSGAPMRHEESARLVVDRLVFRGELAAATTAATQLIHDDPLNPEHHALRAEAHRAAGLFWLADRDLQTAQRLSGQNETYRIRRLQVYLERGSVERVAALSEPDRGRMADEYLAAAVRLISAGSLSTAEKMLTRAMNLTPHRWKPPLLRAGIHMDAGDSERALKDLETALKLSEHREEVLLARAKYALVQKRFPDALADVNLALKGNPQSADAYALRAQARFDAAGTDALVVPEDAIQDLESALSLTPQNPELHLMRSRIALLEGDADGAFAAASKAIRISPGLGEAYFLRAVIRGGIANIFGRQQHERAKVADIEPVLADLYAAVQFAPKHVKARQTRVAVIGIVQEEFTSARSAKSWLSSVSFMKQLAQTAMSHEECLGPTERLGSIGEPKTIEDVERVVAAYRAVMMMAAIGDLRQIAELTGDVKLQEQVKTRLREMSQPK